MKPLLFVLQVFIIAPLILGQPLALAFPNASAPMEWDVQSIGQALGYLLLFGAGGIMLVMECYRLFEKCTARETRGEQGVSEANRTGRPGE